MIPEGSSFEQDNSNGDDCHYNLTNISNGKARRLFKDHYEENLWLCNDGNPSSTTVGKLIDRFISG